MNLHNIVRGAINAVHKDQDFIIYRSLGCKNVSGIVKNTYAVGVQISGSFQSEGDSALDHSNNAGQNSGIRKLYIYASDNPALRPMGVYRPLARTGDYFKDTNNAYWLVIAVEEDFSVDGWESLRVQIQDKTPNLTIEDATNE
jgi:hypothetical protein